jgi:hypothetical protein
LQRRGLAELVAEELRRLDPDDVYGDTLKHALGVDASLAQPGPGDSESVDA